ncbi:hypothetical protein VIAG107301_16225 [Vibrio agarivorans]
MSTDNKRQLNEKRVSQWLPRVFILSHPDYDRRLWVYTRSADLDESSARGLIYN